MLICPSCSHENNDVAKFCEECGVKLEATPVREERKVITALFCDLVGSTALGERLDAEDISRLLREYQATCRARIESHGGVIEKFIGDAVVGVFGVPLAHEDDPERAVRAALRITHDIEASDLGIEVRIGVNTGEALVRLDVDPRSGEGFATGDTMNTAARLEAAAPVMGVAVGEATYRASIGTIVYDELPAISAKGKAEPVPAWQALRPTARVGTEERDRTPFVGRDLELSLLTQLFERARSRPATEFVTVVAEPGLGKSRLVRELARHVDQLAEFVTWREGRCLPYGDGISFWALGEIVKAQAGILETDDQAEVSSKLDRVITEPDPQIRTWIKDRLTPLVGLETTTEPPQRDEAFTAWRRFLEQIAATGPTVLVIEDLHWADDAFVAFLEHLAERTAGLPLLVVVTARPEVEERHPSWPPGRRSTVLSLSPLTDEDLETLITQSLPEADPELIAIVLERAGGSPLYAEQLAAMLRELALPMSGGALDETLIPSSVQALIAARIDSLPQDHKRVLMEAAVVGKTFWRGAVASLGDHLDLEATLGELVRREFCRPVQVSAMEGDAEFGFWHALVRDVAYAELTKTERARMHATTARWIADRTAGAMGEDAEIVVHHLDAALELAVSAPDLDIAGLTELLTQALLAAGKAALRADWAEADRLFKRAVDLLGEGSSEYDEAISLRGRSLQMAGRPADALPFLERAFQAARSIRDHDEAVRLALYLSVAHFQVGNPSASNQVMDELRVELDPTPSPAKAQHLGAMSELALGEGDELRARILFDEGTAVCDQLGISLPPNLLVARGLLRVVKGDLEGEGDVREAVQLLLDAGDPFSAATVLYNLGVGLSEWSVSRGNAVREEAIRLSNERGVGDVNGLLIVELWNGIELGRWDEIDGAKELVREAREAGDLGDESIGLLAIGYVELERTAELPFTERLLELVDSWNPSFWITSFGASLLSRCDDPEARRVGLRLLNRIADSEADNLGRSRLEEVRAAIVAGEMDLAHRLAPRPERFSTPWSRAIADAAAGTLAEAEGRWGDAAILQARATEAMDQLGIRGAIIGPMIGLGRSLVQLGRAEEGVACLTEARTICEELGADMRIAEIEEVLQGVH